MTVVPEAARIRRIVLALEHSGIPPTTLEMVLHLARRLDAELAATLIENSTLLRAAGFPFAREVLRHTGTERALDAGRIADQLRQRLRRLQSDLAARADADGVRTSFRTLRASGVHAALEPRDDGSSGDLVFYSQTQDMTPAAAPTESRIMVVQTTAEMNERLESILKELLAGFPAGATPRMLRIRAIGASDIVAHCRANRSSLLVLPAILPAAELRSIIERAGCPVLTIG